MQARVVSDVTAVVSGRKGCTNLWYKLFRVQKKWVTSAIFKKYLQCILAARILTVNFVVCTLAVKKKRSGQVLTCRIGPFPCKTVQGRKFYHTWTILPDALELRRQNVPLIVTAWTIFNDSFSYLHFSYANLVWCGIPFPDLLLIFWRA
jgi:hypothetical protein